MKTKILILFLISYELYAQNDIKTAKKVGYEKSQEELLQMRRQRAVDFFEFTKHIASPSIISTVVSDFQGNTDPSLNKKNFLLNADIQTPIPLGGKRWYFRTKCGEWNNAIHIVPQYKVKIFQNDSTFNDKSQPVRTPSYLPRLSYYGSPGSWIKNRSISAIFLSAFHHSNGQDGNELFQNNMNSFPFWKAGLVNTYNGNFGEDLVFEIGLVRRKNGQSFDIKGTRFYKYQNQTDRLEKGKGKTIFSSSDTAFVRTQSRLTLEFHPRGLTNEVFDQLDIYGRNRINFKQSWSYISFPTEYLKNAAGKPHYEEFSKSSRKEQYRISLDASLIADRNLNHINNDLSLVNAGMKRRVNANLALYSRLSGTENSAIFIQGGYFGTDPYNIYFNQSGWFFRLGLAFLYFDREQ